MKLPLRRKRGGMRGGGQFGGRRPGLGMQNNTEEN